MTAKVLTANRLTDGISVWLSASGNWETRLSESFVARHDEAVAALVAAGDKALADNRVVDVNIIDVEETATGIRALRLRERIRADGPSIDYAPAHSVASSRAA
ncbi:uncharacterized protein DUF2849 [Hoeflea marina]|uniref:Uncharacterized protein DUF2849 n=1 Tax=Hoeflea marina TaxID=274592 RepID=A0A317PTA7_9HYPH|nr:DUF2849 domain-containing protein [Hoeflea marina]PWW03884.1 uncharacterized protein DUF2849 [Hoeflea marina]